MTKFSEQIIQEESRINNYEGISLSLNKMRYVNATLSPEERMDYFLGFPIFHNRYFELGLLDYENTNVYGKYNKGLWGIAYPGSITPSADKESTNPIKLIDSQKEYYLRKTIEFCMENEIPLVLGTEN